MAGHVVTTAKPVSLSPPLGIVACTLGFRVLYMNGRAHEICLLLRNKSDVRRTNETLPADVRRICKDVAQEIRSNIGRWKEIHLERLVRLPRAVLLQAFGLPDPTGKTPALITVLMEEKDDAQFAAITRFQSRYHLTGREVTVMEHVLCGFSSKEIGARLGISYETVNEHIKHVLVKTHTKTRVAALARLLGVTEEGTVGQVPFPLEIRDRAAPSAMRPSLMPATVAAPS